MSYTVDTSDIERLRASFSVFSDRRFNAGLATALTKTAMAVQAAEQAEMSDVFDRPTKFTLGQVFVRRAEAARLEATVGVSDYPYTVGYLKPHIFGGARRTKGFEKLLIAGGAMRAGMVAVPGRFARLDTNGNISTGQLRQIFSQLRIEPTQGATSVLPRILTTDNAATRKAKSRRIKTAYTRAGGQYIALPDGRGKLLPGIYQARQFAAGRAVPRPVMIFVSSAKYEAERFDFFYVGKLAVQRNLNREVNAAMADQMRRWSEKYGAAR